MHLKPILGLVFVSTLTSLAAAQDSGAVQRIAIESCLEQDE